MEINISEEYGLLKITIEMEQLYKIAEELKMAYNPYVKYNADPVELTNGVIGQMKVHIHRTMARLAVITDGDINCDQLKYVD